MTMELWRRIGLAVVLAVFTGAVESAHAQRFAYAADGFGSTPTGTLTYVVDNADGWDGVLTVYSSDSSTVETELANNGCTVTSGSPPEVDCSAVEDFDVIDAYVVAFAVEISAVETSGTTVRATFTDAAEAWAFMPSSSSITAMEVMEEDNDDCTYECTYGEGIYDENGNSIPPFITCYTTTGSSCCDLTCPVPPGLPGDGPSRFGGMLQRVGAATF